jgi:protein TonB
MSTLTTTAGVDPSPGGAYVLRDELAQFCLPASGRDPTRKVAWVNAVCLCVLMVGLLGVQRPLALVITPRAVEEEVVIVDQPKEIPKVQEFKPDEVQPENNERSDLDVPPIPIPVVADSKALVAPVYVEGLVAIVKDAARAAPPPVIRKAPPVVTETGPKRFTGNREGSFPPPPYPNDAERSKRQGTVRLSWTVTKEGEIKDIQIVSSSGHGDLDRAALDAVKRRWKFKPSAEEERLFYDFEFKLQ